MRRHPDGKCDECGQPETVEHYLMQCPASSIRETIKKKCDEEKMKFTLQNALSTDSIIDAFYDLIDRDL